jgi:DNA repair protein RadC
MKELEKYSVEELLEHIAEVSENEMTRCDSPQVVVNYLKSQLINQRIEKLTCLFLNSKNKIIGESCFEGTVNKAVVFPREIVREALMKDATGLILAHNHPSGECEPSANDIHLTSLIVDAVKPLDIKLLDHIIIGSANKHFSFAEENIL